MGFLSRFRQKKETEIVSPQEACERVRAEIESRGKRLGEEGGRLLERIREHREKLRLQFLELEKKKVPSGLPSNTAGIVRKLKTVLIRKVVQELDSIKKPSPEHEYFERFIRVKKEIIKWSVKNRAAMVVVDEALAKEIGKSLKEMNDIGKEVESLLDDCDTKKLKQIQDEIESTQENVEQGVKKQKEAEGKMEELKTRIKECENGLAEMEEGEEKESFAREKEGKEKAEQELRKSMADLNSELSLLGRPFKKFGRICCEDEIEGWVVRYADEPVKALLEEGQEYPLLKKILEKLLPLVVSGEVELKERVKEKVAEKARSILSGSLEEKVSEALTLMERVEERVDSGIMDRIKGKKRELERLKEELTEQESMKGIKEPDWEGIESRIRSAGIDLKLEW